MRVNIFNYSTEGAFVRSVLALLSSLALMGISCALCMGSDVDESQPGGGEVGAERSDLGHGVQFALQVATVEDVTGDGVFDLLSSAPLAGDFAGTGCLLLLSGRTGEEVSRRYGRTLQGEFPVQLGSGLDLDSDGKREAWCSSQVGGSRQGSLEFIRLPSLRVLRTHDGYLAFVSACPDQDGDGALEYLLDGIEGAQMFSGSSGEPLDSPLNGTHGRSKETWSPIKPLGDVTGDGIADYLLVLASSLDERCVRLLSGEDARVIARYSLPTEHRSSLQRITLSEPLAAKAGVLASKLAIGLSDTNAETGRVLVVDLLSGEVVHELVGPREASAFGYSLGVAPDLNGDSIDDLLVGAPGCSKVFAYSGKDWSPLWEIEGETFSNLGVRVCVPPEGGVGATGGFLVAGVHLNPDGMPARNGSVRLLSKDDRTAVWTRTEAELFPLE